MMEMSESITKIAPALLAAQKAMHAAAKAATNPHFRSKYSDLATIIEAVKEPLNAAGITFLQTLGNDSTGVTVRTSLIHESGEWIAATTYLPVPQQTPQAFGSGITYAKRYGLQSICGLPSEDDDGERASEPEKADAHRVEKKDSARQVAVDAFDELPAEKRDEMRTHASAITKLHAKRGDVVTYLAEQDFDQEGKLALWSLLPSNVRSWIKEQEQMARMRVAAQAMKNTELGAQA